MPGPLTPLTENFSVLGYHVTGSTGTLFLFGIVIGALAMLGMSVLLAGARRTAGRGRDARRELKRSQREAESCAPGPRLPTQPVEGPPAPRWTRNQPRPDRGEEGFVRSLVIRSATDSTARGGRR